MPVRRAWLAAALLGVAACSEPVDTSWHREQGYRWRALDVPLRGRGAGFTPLEGSTTGITHANLVDDEHALANRNLILGAGAAVGDIDGDDRPDVFVASVERPAALYRNDGGMRFSDVTRPAGLALEGTGTTGGAFADVDGDGDLDLLAGTLGGPLLLFTNDGKGKFTDATAMSGLEAGFAATTLALADVDSDGDLDLYVATYKVRNSLDAFTPQQRAFDQVVKKVGATYKVLPEWEKEYRIEDRPDLGGIVRSQRAERDLFYLNDGRGHFAPQPTAGARWLDEEGKPLAEAPDFFSLSARFHDVNGDGFPDLYVCNDFEDPDQFWLGDGKGTFRMVPLLALRATSNTCMSVDFGDVNRDGAIDLFTADMLSPTREARQRQVPTHTPLRKTVGDSPERQQWMRNTLQVARGDGTWAQVADFAGVEASDWTWGSAFMDVDLDGWEDLLLAAGHRWDVRDADTFDRIRNAFPRVPWNREQGEFPRLAVPGKAYRNNRDLTFTDRATDWRFAADSGVWNAIALGDFDGDGDLDPLLTRLGEPPVLHRNESNAPRVAVRLAGRAPNTQGIGAVVTVRAPSLPVQSREVDAGGSYLSGHEALLAFAVGGDTALSIEVRWRSGKRSVVEGGRANRLYVIDEAGAVDAPPAMDAEDAGGALFSDATALLGGQSHTDSLFDDFARQPLLPNRFSQLGPGIAWGDVDGDGREDLIVGAGRGGRGAVLRNTRGGFVRADGGAVAGDMGGIVPLVRDGKVTILAAQSNYEARDAATGTSIPSVVAIPVAGGRLGASAVAVPGDTATAGAIAVGDVDGDGLLDLFVGGRLVPGAWPLPARSRLYRGTTAGGFVLDEANAPNVAALGMVTAATFADVNGDARADLVVASEWGPVRVLLNDAGRLRDATRSLGISGISSRWLGVTAGDFDGDGRLDLVATSWGRNTPWKASADAPYVAMVGRQGADVGIVFAQYDSATRREMPLESFSRLGVAFPAIRERIASYTEFARADVAALLGDEVKSFVRIGATTFDHTLFLNRGTSFEARALPSLAQVAPSTAPVVADFDGDGREDLFLAQNFYPTEIGTIRFDAGAGLVMLGDGAGGFTPLEVARSGVSILGDQRGAATADYDGDARPDVAVAQNGGRTRLLHNEGGRPGVRVRLRGKGVNPLGIGAQLRIVAGGRKGAVREVRAGSGYWSTDGAVTVMALPDGTAQLEVRWPGGATQRVDIPAGAREVTVVADR